MKRIENAFWLLALSAVLLLTGCSGFNRDWKKAVAASTMPTDISGAWQGTWESKADGHSDQLRCIVTKVSDSQYNARFHAKYQKVLSFSYTVPLHVQKTGKVYTFEGNADLGRLAGGVYHYEGQATATNFFSTYYSKYDNGVFQMKRPE